MPTLLAHDLPTHFRSLKQPAHKARAGQSVIPVKRKGIHPGTQVVQASAFEPRLTERVPGLSEYPYSSICKMMFQGIEGLFVGSAWVIGKRGIVTAAHCLYDEDAKDFYDNITFLFGFNGTNEGERIPAIESAIHPNYTAKAFPENLQWDLGVAVVDRDLIPDFGALGYDASGRVSAEEVEAVGYPAESRPIPASENNGQTDNENFNFDGSHMWHSIGENLGEDGNLHGMENEMTGGCSGGPWIVDEGVAVGLNSHRLVPHDNRMFSPLFDEDFLQLLEWLAERDAF